MKKLLLLTTLLAIGLSSPGCSLLKKSKPTVDPIIEELQIKADFVPTKEMTRFDVENVIGTPVHFGRTKEGNLICMYLFEGMESPRITDARYKTAYGKGYSARRSIVYDRDNNVVSWYGFERSFNIEPGTSEPAED